MRKPKLSAITNGNEALIIDNANKRYCPIDATQLPKNISTTRLSKTEYKEAKNHYTNDTANGTPLAAYEWIPKLSEITTS